MFVRQNNINWLGIWHNYAIWFGCWVIVIFLQYMFNANSTIFRYSCLMVNCIIIYLISALSYFRYHLSSLWFMNHIYMWDWYNIPLTMSNRLTHVCALPSVWHIGGNINTWYQRHSSWNCYCKFYNRFHRLGVLIIGNSLQSIWPMPFYVLDKYDLSRSYNKCTDT